MNLNQFDFILQKSMTLQVYFEDGSSGSVTYKPNKNNQFLSFFVGEFPKHYFDDHHPEFLVPFVSVARLIGDAKKDGEAIIDNDDRTIVDILRKPAEDLSAQDAATLQAHLLKLIAEQGFNLKA